MNRKQRQPLLAARAFAGGRLLIVPAELRQFRADIQALPPEHPAAAVAAQHDFYSLSMLRDLLFHVQEHRYTVTRLRAEIEKLGLEFCGFNLPPELYVQFRTLFGATADMRSLALWERFEEAHPSTFAGMYQFLVRKPASAS